MEERQGGSHITHSHEPALSLSLHALSGMLCASASSKPPYKYVLPDVGFTGWLSLTSQVSEMFFFFCQVPTVIWRSQIVAGCCCSSTLNNFSKGRSDLLAWACTLFFILT